ncbi:UvrD-helicase domain-containing protein, partial [Kitasatospora sp. NPDC001574]
MTASVRPTTEVDEAAGPEQDPDPDVWSNRIQIITAGRATHITGTGQSGFFELEDDLRQLLRDSGFGFKKSESRWTYGRRDRRGLPRILDKIRDYLADMDERETAASAAAAVEQVSHEYPPTPQQQKIIDACLAGQDVAVQALAGTGKTSTLLMVTRRLPDKRIAYIAFNRSIADEAKRKMPRNVTSDTSHAFARAALKGEPIERKVVIARTHPGARRDKDVAAALGITRPLMFEGGEVDPEDIASIAMQAVRLYRESADDELGRQHLGAWGRTPAAPGLLDAARRAWADITDPDSDKIVFKSDDYIKIWALRRPRLPYSMILFDEAQDINPVLKRVIQDQPTQTIVVGDSQQSIYSFRGAIDALKDWPADTVLPLTQSWRFGPQVAAVGNRYLNLLGADLQLQGNPALDTTIGLVDEPDAILTKTNIGAVGAVFEGLDAGKRVAMVGGGTDIKQIALAAKDLKAGRRTKHAELSAFEDWEEVRQYAESNEDAKALQTFVRLLDNYSPDDIINMVQQLVPEDAKDPAQRPQLTVSTAHKAKGREWDQVRIGPDFPQPKEDTETGELVLPGAEDLRLAYVTVTRAKQRLELGSLDYVLRVDGAMPRQPSATSGITAAQEPTEPDLPATDQKLPAQAGLRPEEIAAATPQLAGEQPPAHGPQITLTLLATPPGQMSVTLTPGGAGPATRPLGGIGDGATALPVTAVVPALVRPTSREQHLVEADEVAAWLATSLPLGSFADAWGDERIRAVLATAVAQAVNDTLAPSADELITWIIDHVVPDPALARHAAAGSQSEFADHLARAVDHAMEDATEHQLWAYIERDGAREDVLAHATPLAYEAALQAARATAGPAIAPTAPAARAGATAPPETTGQQPKTQPQTSPSEQAAPGQDRDDPTDPEPDEDTPTPQTAAEEEDRSWEDAQPSGPVTDDELYTGLKVMIEPDRLAELARAIASEDTHPWVAAHTKIARDRKSYRPMRTPVLRRHYTQDAKGLRVRVMTPAQVRESHFTWAQLADRAYRRLPQDIGAQLMNLDERFRDIDLSGDPELQGLVNRAVDAVLDQIAHGEEVRPRLRRSTSVTQVTGPEPVPIPEAAPADALPGLVPGTGPVRPAPTTRELPGRSPFPAPERLNDVPPVPGELASARGVVSSHWNPTDGGEVPNVAAQRVLAAGGDRSDTTEYLRMLQIAERLEPLAQFDANRHHSRGEYLGQVKAPWIWGQQATALRSDIERIGELALVDYLTRINEADFDPQELREALFGTPSPADTAGETRHHTLLRQAFVDRLAAARAAATKDGADPDAVVDYLRRTAGQEPGQEDSTPHALMAVLDAALDKAYLAYARAHLSDDAAAFADHLRRDAELTARIQGAPPIPLPDKSRWVARDDVEPGTVIRRHSDGQWCDAELVEANYGRSVRLSEVQQIGGYSGEWGRSSHVAVVEAGPDVTAVKRKLKTDKRLREAIERNRASWQEQHGNPAADDAAPSLRYGKGLFSEKHRRIAIRATLALAAQRPGPGLASVSEPWVPLRSTPADLVKGSWFLCGSNDGRIHQVTRSGLSRNLRQVIDPTIGPDIYLSPDQQITALAPLEVLVLPGEDLPGAMDPAERRTLRLAAAASPSGLLLDDQGHRLVDLDLASGTGNIVDAEGRTQGWVRARTHRGVRQWWAQDARDGNPAPDRWTDPVGAAVWTAWHTTRPLTDPVTGRAAPILTAEQLRHLAPLAVAWRSADDPGLAEAATAWTRNALAGQPLSHGGLPVPSPLLYTLAEAAHKAAEAADAGTDLNSALTAVSQALRAEAQFLDAAFGPLPPVADPDPLNEVPTTANLHGTESADGQPKQLLAHQVVIGDLVRAPHLIGGATTWVQGRVNGYRAESVSAIEGTVHGHRLRIEDPERLDIPFVPFGTRVHVLTETQLADGVGAPDQSVTPLAQASPTERSPEGWRAVDQAPGRLHAGDMVRIRRGDAKTIRYENVTVHDGPDYAGWYEAVGPHSRFSITTVVAVPEPDTWTAPVTEGTLPGLELVPASPSPACPPAPRPEPAPQQTALQGVQRDTPQASDPLADNDPEPGTAPYREWQEGDPALFISPHGVLSRGTFRELQWPLCVITGDDGAESRVPVRNAWYHDDRPLQPPAWADEVPEGYGLVKASELSIGDVVLELNDRVPGIVFEAPRVVVGDFMEPGGLLRLSLRAMNGNSGHSLRAAPHTAVPKAQTGTLVNRAAAKMMQPAFRKARAAAVDLAEGFAEHTVQAMADTTAGRLPRFLRPFPSVEGWAPGDTVEAFTSDGVHIPYGHITKGEHARAWWVRDPQGHDHLAPQGRIRRTPALAPMPEPHWAAELPATSRILRANELQPGQIAREVRPQFAGNKLLGPACLVVGTGPERQESPNLRLYTWHPETDLPSSTAGQHSDGVHPLAEYVVDAGPDEEELASRLLGELRVRKHQELAALRARILADDTDVPADQEAAQIPDGNWQPVVGSDLDLQGGEIVRVRHRASVLSTRIGPLTGGEHYQSIDPGFPFVFSAASIVAIPSGTPVPYRAGSRSAKRQDRQAAGQVPGQEQIDFSLRTPPTAPAAEEPEQPTGSAPADTGAGTVSSGEARREDLSADIGGRTHDAPPLPPLVRIQHHHQDAAAITVDGLRFSAQFHRDAHGSGQWKLSLGDTTPIASAVDVDSLVPEAVRHAAELFQLPADTSRWPEVPVQGNEQHQWLPGPRLRFTTGGRTYDIGTDQILHMVAADGAGLVADSEEEMLHVLRRHATPRRGTAVEHRRTGPVDHEPIPGSWVYISLDPSTGRSEYRIRQEDGAGLVPSGGSRFRQATPAPAADIATVPTDRADAFVNRSGYRTAGTWEIINATTKRAPLTSAPRQHAPSPAGAAALEQSVTPPAVVLFRAAVQVEQQLWIEHTDNITQVHGADPKDKEFEGVRRGVGSFKRLADEGTLQSWGLPSKWKQRVKRDERVTWLVERLADLGREIPVYLSETDRAAALQPGGRHSAALEQLGSDERRRLESATADDRARRWSPLDFEPGDEVLLARGWWKTVHAVEAASLDAGDSEPVRLGRVLARRRAGKITSADSPAPATGHARPGSLDTAKMTSAEVNAELASLTLPAAEPSHERLIEGRRTQLVERAEYHYSLNSRREQERARVRTWLANPSQAPAHLVRVTNDDGVLIGCVIPAGNDYQAMGVDGVSAMDMIFGTVPDAVVGCHELHHRRQELTPNGWTSVGWSQVATGELARLPLTQITPRGEVTVGPDRWGEPFTLHTVERAPDGSLTIHGDRRGQAFSERVPADTASLGTCRPAAEGANKDTTGRAGLSTGARDFGLSADPTPSAAEPPAVDPNGTQPFVAADAPRTTPAPEAAQESKAARPPVPADVEGDEPSAAESEETSDGALRGQLGLDLGLDFNSDAPVPPEGMAIVDTGDGYWTITRADNAKFTVARDVIEDGDPLVLVEPDGTIVTSSPQWTAIFAAAARRPARPNSQQGEPAHEEPDDPDLPQDTLISQAEAAEQQDRMVPAAPDGASPVSEAGSGAEEPDTTLDNPAPSPFEFGETVHGHQGLVGTFIGVDAEGTALVRAQDGGPLTPRPVAELWRPEGSPAPQRSRDHWPAALARAATAEGIDVEEGGARLSQLDEAAGHGWVTDADGTVIGWIRARTHASGRTMWWGQDARGGNPYFMQWHDAMPDTAGIPQFRAAKAAAYDHYRNLGKDRQPTLAGDVTIELELTAARVREISLLSLPADADNPIASVAFRPGTFRKYFFSATQMRTYAEVARTAADTMGNDTADSRRRKKVLDGLATWLQRQAHETETTLVTLPRPNEVDPWATPHHDANRPPAQTEATEADPAAAIPTAQAEAVEATPLPSPAQPGSATVTTQPSEGGTVDQAGPTPDGARQAIGQPGQTLTPRAAQVTSSDLLKGANGPLLRIRLRTPAGLHLVLWNPQGGAIAPGDEVIVSGIVAKHSTFNGVLWTELRGSRVELAADAHERATVRQAAPAGWTAITGDRVAPQLAVGDQARVVDLDGPYARPDAPTTVHRHAPSRTREAVTAYSSVTVESVTENPAGDRYTGRTRHGRELTFAASDIAAVKPSPTTASSVPPTQSTNPAPPTHVQPQPQDPTPPSTADLAPSERSRLRAALAALPFNRRVATWAARPLQADDEVLIGDDDWLRVADANPNTLRTTDGGFHNVASVYAVRRANLITTATDTTPLPPEPLGAPERAAEPNLDETGPFSDPLVLLRTHQRMRHAWDLLEAVIRKHEVASEGAAKVILENDPSVFAPGLPITGAKTSKQSPQAVVAAARILAGHPDERTRQTALATLRGAVRDDQHTVRSRARKDTGHANASVRRAARDLHALTEHLTERLDATPEVELTALLGRARACATGRDVEVPEGWAYVAVPGELADGQEVRVQNGDGTYSVARLTEAGPGPWQSTDLFTGRPRTVDAGSVVALHVDQAPEDPRAVGDDSDPVDV